VNRDTAEKLSRLQGLDDQVRKFRALLEEKPALVAEERKAMEGARARLAEADKRHKEGLKAADRRELYLKTREADAIKLEGQLNTATSNKVYSELLLNIRSARQDISKIEESILELMDEAEALEAAVERARVEVRNADEEFREAENALKAEMADLQGKLTQKEALRAALAKEVEAEVLATYERIRGSRKGIGVTRVEAGGENQYYCTTCQMDVTVQDVTLAMRPETIGQCRSCNRILLIEVVPEREAAGS
jgi:predicted  nucleic acid-binding Zn-ribbon protein